MCRDCQTWHDEVPESGITVERGLCDACSDIRVLKAGTPAKDNVKKERKR